jgi:hypothetical protein
MNAPSEWERLRNTARMLRMRALKTRDAVKREALIRIARQYEETSDRLRGEERSEAEKTWKR